MSQSDFVSSEDMIGNSLEPKRRPWKILIVGKLCINFIIKQNKYKNIMFYYFLSLVVCTFSRWWRGNYPQLPHALAPKMPVFIGFSACAPAADCAPGSVERARPVSTILAAVAVERHAVAVGVGARCLSNVTPSPPGSASRRHWQAARANVTPSPGSSSRRGRGPVHPLDVAGGLFILSPSASRSPGWIGTPSPGRSARPRTSRSRWQVPGANGCPVVLSVRRKKRAASPGGRGACSADST